MTYIDHVKNAITEYPSWGYKFMIVWSVFWTTLVLVDAGVSVNTSLSPAIQFLYVMFEALQAIVSVGIGFVIAMLAIAAYEMFLRRK